MTHLQFKTNFYEALMCNWQRRTYEPSVLKLLDVPQIHVKMDKIVMGMYCMHKGVMPTFLLFVWKQIHVPQQGML